MARSLKTMAAQLGALGHPARLAILRQVVEAGPEGVTTTGLRRRLGIPWTTLNHHLDRLVASRLLRSRRKGRLAVNTADYRALSSLTDFLWKDCCRSGRPGGCC